MSEPIHYKGTLTVSNPSPPKWIPYGDMPWLYRGANLELVQLVTASLLVGVSLAALFWMLT